MKNIATWKLIIRSLEKNIAVMLLYVLESSGSSPGRQGFFMVVNANGEMEGSIGGGIMEHKFVEMGKMKLLTICPEPFIPDLRKQVHDKTAAKDQSGMICSGEQTILLYQVKDSDKADIQKLIASLEQNKNGILTLSPGMIQFCEEAPARDFDFEFTSETEWLYKEKTGYKNSLFIIGGGHCSLALSKLMRQMDFYIQVYDERKELKMMMGNESAHAKHVVPDFTSLEQLIPAGDNHFVVIMTFGYRTDDIALRTLMEKDFKYIGLLGSKAKTGKLLDTYRREGISEERLQRIHTPIGLDIKSQTPEEIAVSIAAEIIQIKNLRL